MFSVVSSNRRHFPIDEHNYDGTVRYVIIIVMDTSLSLAFYIYTLHQSVKMLHCPCNYSDLSDLSLGVR